MCRSTSVFIGSCTNGRIEDLRSAAAVVEGRKVAAGVEAWVVPGSGPVKAQAEAEGLDRVFTAAGFQWRHAGCSMCLGTNGDIGAPGERCASTTNRNFVGRQGPGARTHLLSPMMAAAAAVTGRLTDVRQLMDGRGSAMKPFEAPATPSRCRSSSRMSTPIRSCPRATCRSRAPTISATICSATCAARRTAPSEPAFVLNQAAYRDGTILVAAAQFRLRIVARARGLGALRPRLPRRHRARASAISSSRTR